MELFLEMTGTDMGNIENELEKLLSYTMGKEPYMEASVGIENIFKFLRLDYVWRLNYRDHPDIQTKGVRATMRISF